MKRSPYSIVSASFFVLFSLAFLINISAQDRAGDYKQYMDQGREEALQGKYRAAITNFNQAIGLMPYYYLLYQDRGYAEMQLKQYDEAISDFSVVLDKKPYVIESRYLRGIAYFNVDRLEDALSDMEYLANEPNPPKEVQTYLEKIRYLLSQEQKKSASVVDKEWQIEQQKLERERIERSRQTEAIIWGTVVPLAFWTAVFLTW